MSMKDIWAKTPPAERSEIMREIAGKRWKTKSKDERLAHSKMMNEAKKEKRGLTFQE